MKVKRSEEYEALEEVFDKPTLMAMYSLMNSGVIDKLFGVFRSGKEARIYRALGRDGKELAVKIFLTGSAEFRKGLSIYIHGDPRFARVSRDSRQLRYLWALKEFKNLRKAREVGIKVPEPIKIEKNILIMEFLGKNGKPAPTLRESQLSDPSKTYKKVVESIKVLFQKAELVHGDLSEFNIMIFHDEPYMFDMSQAILLSHPLSQELLKRDLTNLTAYFQKLGVKTALVRDLEQQIMQQTAKTS